MKRWIQDGSEIRISDREYVFDVADADVAMHLVATHNAMADELEALERMYSSEVRGHQITAKTALECLAEFEAMRRKAHDIGVDWNNECDKVNSQHRKLVAANEQIVLLLKKLHAVQNFASDGYIICGELDPDGERHGSTDYSWITYGDDAAEVIRKEIKQIVEETTL